MWVTPDTGMGSLMVMILIVVLLLVLIIVMVSVILGKEREICPTRNSGRKQHCNNNCSIIVTTMINNNVFPAQGLGVYLNHIMIATRTNSMLHDGTTWLPN